MQTRSRRQNQRERRVWFPVDEKGEPDNRNPDNGCGGFTIHLETIRYYFVTSDGKFPSEDGENILEGKAARKKVKENKIGKDWQQTFDLAFREFNLTIEKGGCGGLWEVFEKKVFELEEPDYCLVGQKWRSLYGNEKRVEEKEMDKKDMQKKRAQIEKIVQDSKEKISQKENSDIEVNFLKHLQKCELKGKREKIMERKKGMVKYKFIANPPKTPPSRNKQRKYKEFPRRTLTRRY